MPSRRPLLLGAGAVCVVAVAALAGLALSGGDDGGGGGSGSADTSPETSEIDVPTDVADLAAFVAGQPPGSTFRFSAGTYAAIEIEPREGDQFVAREEGVVFDGGGTATFAIGGTADDVVLRGLRVTNYASALQQAAIQAVDPEEDDSSPGAQGERWLLEDLEVDTNASVGIFLGSGATLRDSHIHDNGQLGIKAYGGVDLLVEGNEISGNNTAMIDAGFEAGGAKFVATTRLTVRANDVHDNQGPGLWTDFDNLDTLYEDNVVSDNWGAGIFHEISGTATIRNNTVSRNGLGEAESRGDGRWLWGAGILVSTSSDVEVTGNTLDGNANGITAVQQDRGADAPELRNLWVHDNVVGGSGTNGVAQDVDDSSIYLTRDLRFESNQYLAPGPYSFHWNDRPLDFATWQSLGNDLAGTAT